MLTFDNVKVGDKVVTRNGKNGNVVENHPEIKNFVVEFPDEFLEETNLPRRFYFSYTGSWLGSEFLGQVVYRPEELRGKIDWKKIWHDLYNEKSWVLATSVNEFIQQAVEQQLKGK